MSFRVVRQIGVRLNVVMLSAVALYFHFLQWPPAPWLLVLKTVARHTFRRCTVRKGACRQLTGLQMCHQQNIVSAKCHSVKWFWSMIKSCGTTMENVTRCHNIVSVKCFSTVSYGAMLENSTSWKYCVNQMSVSQKDLDEKTWHHDGNVIIKTLCWPNAIRSNGFRSKDAEPCQTTFNVIKAMRRSNGYRPKDLKPR